MQQSVVGFGNGEVNELWIAVTENEGPAVEAFKSKREARAAAERWNRSTKQRAAIARFTVDPGSIVAWPAGTADDEEEETNCYRID